MIRRVTLTAFTFFVGLAIFGASQIHAAPSFTKESVITLSSASPQSVVPYVDGYRMYFIRDYEVHSATSVEGISWGEESGVRVSSALPLLNQSSVPITGCSVIPISSGLTMLFSVGASTGPFGIFQTTSLDGVSWSPAVISVVIIGTGTTFVGSPAVVRVSDNNLKLFYVQDKNGGNNPASKVVYSANSADDGSTWSLPTLALNTRVSEISVSTRSDARVRLYFTAPPTGGNIVTTIGSALGDILGGALTVEGDVRLTTNNASGFLSNPVVVRSTDSFRYRLYYNFTPTGSTDPSPVFTALTLTPNPQFITPNSAFVSDSSAAVTIKGEIFSPTPTVALRLTGQADIAGTEVTRTDDQTITATFGVASQAMGAWSVVVTNSDGLSGILPAAFSITFKSGDLTLVDNVMRPRLGIPTQITINVFVEGKVTVKLYTIDGRLVETLLDEELTAAPRTINWFGKTSDGHLVASGTYVVVAEGPKLKATKKIVVIR